MNKQIDEQPTVQPDTPPKAPWQTPTLSDFSVEKETAFGGGSGPDGTSGPNAS